MSGFINRGQNGLGMPMNSVDVDACVDVVIITDVEAVQVMGTKARGDVT